MQTRLLDLCRPLAWMVPVWLAAVLAPGAAAAAEGRTGEQIYRQMCARCHGTTGEGTREHYPRALAGKRSADQLARLIAKTMPLDEPGKCTGEDADKVASYIYDAFYSPAAQARNPPPRIELSRLTVRQYRNSVTDLIRSFRTPGRWDEKRGLKGEYFNARRIRNARPVLERIDPAVRFDFGTASPDAEKLAAHEFTVRWTGAVLAPETGTYEFVVRTEHAARLWVNDPNRPLIDAWVKSGDDTEYRAPVYLLGGRVYPLKLEFSKAKQGVDDSKKVVGPPSPVQASIALHWKPPRLAEEPVPPRNLSPNPSPELFVVTTPFPADDRSAGYERGASVSRAWDQATTEAALETAAYVTARLRELAGDGAEREFCLRFAERAFRRPLTEEERQLYVDRQFAMARDPEAAVKRVVLLVLKSPRFLYREIGGGPDSHDAAARLSFGLWDSLPDTKLLQAATKGELATREQAARQAERMLDDLRARGKLREFFLQWLKVEEHPDLAKDAARFPGFDAALASDLRTSLELFLEEVLWGEAPDFRRLLRSDHLYLNGRLARFYGADLPADAPFQKVSLQPRERAGVLTHPYLSATFAYTEESSPIHRGVFLARSVLGRSLRPPPDAFTPLPADDHPGLTTRQRVELQTRPAACASCHGLINPLGFPLENFDAVGRYRDRERGKPIDAGGAYQTRAGEVVKFAGVRDLATFLADSEEVHEAFVEQLFHYLVKQPVRSYGPRTLSDLRQDFVESRYNVRKLTAAIVAASALKGRDDKP